MDFKEKLILLLVGIIMALVATMYAMNTFGHRGISPEDIQVSERTTQEEEIVDPEEKVEKVYVNVFFIGQNENHEEVYKAVKREYKAEIDGSKLHYAIDSLVTGPKASEKAKGVYTEIPAGTHLIYVKEYPDKAIINLTSTFETGGGTDSLYKRLYQLIKTARQNTDVPVYLYIEGKRADVIGGDGIMLSQPLSDRSLDG